MQGHYKNWTHIKPSKKNVCTWLLIITCSETSMENWLQHIMTLIRLTRQERQVCVCLCVRLCCRVAEGVRRQGSWKETPLCWSLGMQHARGLARLAPNSNSLPTPLPVPVPFLPRLSREPLLHSFSQTLHPTPWNGRALVSTSSDKISNHPPPSSIPALALLLLAGCHNWPARIALWRLLSY